MMSIVPDSMHGMESKESHDDLIVAMVTQNFKCIDAVANAIV